VHHAGTLPQHDARRGPAHGRGTVDRFCHLEVVASSDMLNDAVAGIARGSEYQ